RINQNEKLNKGTKMLGTDLNSGSSLMPQSARVASPSIKDSEVSLEERSNSQLSQK
ncbi:hypothetical protein RUND412_009134, partial [Rhizina undulata]